MSSDSETQKADLAQFLGRTFADSGYTAIGVVSFTEEEVTAMAHTLARRLHSDEKHIPPLLETVFLQYGVLLGAIVLVAVAGVGIIYFRH